MASRNEIPEPGPGLLGGFFMGAIGGAEQYIQEENTQRRAMSLEDYRAQRARELEDYKNKLRDEENKEVWAREDAATARDERWKKREYTSKREKERLDREAADADREIDRTRAEAELARANKAERSNDPYSQLPDAGEKANYLLNVMPDIESAYPDLFGGANGTNPALSLEKNPKADKRTAETIITKLSQKKDDPRAQTIVQAMRRYLQHNAVWTNADFMEWTQQTQEAVSAMAPPSASPAGSSGFTIIGKKQG